MGSLPDHSWPHSHASHYCPAACLSLWILVVLNVGSYLYWKRGEGGQEENLDSCKDMHPTFWSFMAQPMEMRGQ